MFETTKLSRTNKKDELMLRAIRRKVEGGRIEQLSIFGYKIEKITDFQYRIDGKIDIYPTNKKYHNLISHSRGGYKNLLKTVEIEIGRKKWIAKLCRHVVIMFDFKRK